MSPHRHYFVLQTLVDGLRPYKAGDRESLSALDHVRLAELRAYRAARQPQ